MPTFKDRVAYTTTTTGTGTITLGSAVAQHQALAAGDDGLSFDYTIEDANGTGWEVGTGTYTHSGTTLSRGATASSNSGSAITLSAGTHNVFLTVSASNLNKVANLMVADAAAQRTALGVGLGYISGLTYSRYSGTQLTINPGTVDIAGTFLTKASASDETVTVTTSSTSCYYIYAYNNSGSLAFEYSTTDPVWSNTYNAYYKTGDSTRRCIGWYLTHDYSGTDHIEPFVQTGSGRDRKQSVAPANTSHELRVLNGGTATTKTSVSLSGFCPTVILKKVYLSLIFTLSSAATAIVGTTGNSGGVDDKGRMENQTQLSMNAGDFFAGSIGCTTNTNTIYYVVYPSGSGVTAYMDMASVDFEV